MINKECYVYTSKEAASNRTVIIAWEQGARELYPIAQQLHSRGCGVDVILGFSDAEEVEMECEYAALSDRLYVFTTNGSHGAKTDAKGAVAELLSCGERPETMYICCPEEMRKRIDESIMENKFV